MNDKEIRLSEDEDVERAKEWWNKNGTSIIAGIAIGLSVVVGFNFWTGQKAKKASAASSLYETLVSEDSADAKQAANDALSADFGGSIYAQLGLLRTAKQQVEGGELESAAKTLRLVMASDPELGIAAIAGLRLAGLLVELENYEEANSVLNSSLLAHKEYAARVNEIKGDALLKAGSLGEAKTAYEKSIAILSENGQSANLVQLKLDNI